MAAEAEAAIVVLIGVPATVPAGFALAAVTLGGFGYALVRALGRERATPCRCLGSSATPVGRHHVIRNLVLIAAAVTASGATLGGASQAVEIPGAAITGVAALVCVVLVVRLDDIAELFRPTAAGR